MENENEIKVPEVFMYRQTFIGDSVTQEEILSKFLTKTNSYVMCRFLGVSIILTSQFEKAVFRHCEFVGCIFILDRTDDNRTPFEFLDRADSPLIDCILDKCSAFDNEKMQPNPIKNSEIGIAKVLRALKISEPKKETPKPNHLTLIKREQP